MTALYATVDELRETVAVLLEEEPAGLADEANLFEAGLDSILLMRLVTRWRKAGADVDFAGLAGRPTVGEWYGLLEEGAAEPEPSAPLLAPPAGEDFPLAPMQHAYWAGRSTDHCLGGVAAHLYAEFDGGGLEAAPLQTALDALVVRHETLRSRVTPDGRQTVLPAAPALLTVHDLREVPQGRIDVRLTSIRDALSHQLLDIESGQTFSAALTLLPEGRTRFHLDVDMVAADAVSYRILLADLAALYTAPDGTGLPRTGFTHRQYLAGREAGRGAARERAAAHWRERVPELPGAPELPLVLPRRGRQPRPRVARRHFGLPAERAARLAAEARKRGLTPAMAVASAFAEVVGHWSATQSFLLNVPLFDRLPLHPGVEHIAGDFSGSVLLEIDLGERLPFTERVRRTQERMHADASHADHGGVDVLRDLTHRDGRRTLAPVVFTSALNLGDLFAPEVRARFGEPVWIVSQSPQVLLDAQLAELDGGLLVDWDTREEAFPPGVLDSMFDAFEKLVYRIAAGGAVWDEPVEMPRPGKRLHDGRAVRVVDAHGRDRPDHVPGALLAPDGSGWTPTGELARALPGGTVELLAGPGEHLTSGGVLVGAREVEQALLGDDRVTGATAAVLDGESGPAFGAVVAATAPAADILRELRLRVPGRLVPRRLTAVPALPVTEAGAPDTAAVRALLARPAEPESGAGDRR
ncbi:hypothetical protein GCM10010387_46140 [Streptomyces inusitatus]|uniref:Carrier domain-containing protein n=1 Tax=Streptomyces inusitatus TaxID=68221 RepID=A0A918QHV8_9ACTN|nr:condensation domain-containing protein [Streptomyces inusitatus]GGZ46466.1 hypothetical protein GCM10010387_46140 [Streptomyces inusitatus]